MFPFAHRGARLHLESGSVKADTNSRGGPHFLSEVAQ